MLPKPLVCDMQHSFVPLAGLQMPASPYSCHRIISTMMNCHPNISGVSLGCSCASNPSGCIRAACVKRFNSRHGCGCAVYISTRLMCATLVQTAPLICCISYSLDEALQLRRLVGIRLCDCPLIQHVLDARHTPAHLQSHTAARLVKQYCEAIQTTRRSCSCSERLRC